MDNFTTARKATLIASPVFSLSMLVGCLGIASIPAGAIAQLQDTSTSEAKLPEVALAEGDRTLSPPEVAPTEEKVAEINPTTESDLSPTAAAQPPPTTPIELAATDIPDRSYPSWLSQSPVLNPQSPIIAEVPRIPDFPTETGTAADLSAPDDFAQVTSVSQLSDVQPTDWAFQALQSLVERYGCIAGYPDGTFRGNRALTRYEFAAGLNACLDQVNRLIAGGTNNLATKEDLIALQRLQEEFAAELATLRGRVDALEARTAELEANQFSTTTKLSGLAWFNVTGATANKRVRVETTNTDTPLALRPAGRDPITNRPVVQRVDDPEVTFSQLVWLTLTTSFTGKDQLVTQLAVGNGDSPANQFASAGLYNTFGTPFLDQTGGVNPNEFILRELFYQFPLSDRLQVVVGPRINFYRYFDNNAFTFFLNGASTFNSNGSTLSNTVDRGAGAVVLWDINRRFRLRLGYLGESDEFLPANPFNSAADPSKGLFKGTNSATVELAFSPSSRANFRFLYTRSNIQQIGGQVGGAIGEPIYGVADDGYGGKIGNATADTFIFNFDWLVARNFGVFGRYSYGRTNIFPRTDRPDGTIKAQAYQMGLAFPDLGKDGALLTLSFLVPFDVTGGRRFLVSGGGNGGTQYEFEATYYLPISDNIAIVPAFYLIGNANNFDNNPTIYVGNLRTQFSF